MHAIDTCSLFAVSVFMIIRQPMVPLSLQSHELPQIPRLLLNRLCREPSLSPLFPLVTSLPVLHSTPSIIHTSIQCSLHRNRVMMTHIGKMADILATVHIHIFLLKCVDIIHVHYITVYRLLYMAIYMLACTCHITHTYIHVHTV